MTKFKALLRRELWEHTTLRGIPLGLLLFVLLVNIAFSVTVLGYGTAFSFTDTSGTQSLAELINSFVEMPVERQSTIVNGTLITSSMIINSIILIMMFFYLLDSLYGERKDHSILFWKSLPVTDTQTVLAKLTIAALIVPVIIFMTALLANLLTLAIQSWSVRDYPSAATVIWQRADLVNLSTMSLFLLIQQTIWYFPVMGWLLFCSAWSRKAPIIAAVLIPALLVFLDSSFMLRTGISEILIERLPLGVASMQLDDESSLLAYETAVQQKDTLGKIINRGMTTPDYASIVRFFGNARVWAGILVGALFIAMAIWFRRWRDDSL